jgi:hypothetical protein
MRENRTYGSEGGEALPSRPLSNPQLAIPPATATVPSSPPEIPALRLRFGRDDIGNLVFILWHAEQIADQNPDQVDS